MNIISKQNKIKEKNDLTYHSQYFRIINSLFSDINKREYCQYCINVLVIFYNNNVENIT